MNILICGKQASGKSRITEKLRDYFTYRGTACYTYDYMTPITNIIESMQIVGPESLQYGATLQGILYKWGVLGWKTACVDTVAEATSRWRELGLHFIAIIDGAPKEMIRAYKDGGAFAVYLNCPDEVRHNRLEGFDGSARGEGHPIEVGFNDCAVSDIFDLVVDTSEHSPEEVASLIGTEFQNKINDAFKKTPIDEKS